MKALIYAILITIVSASAHTEDALKVEGIGGRLKLFDKNKSMFDILSEDVTFIFKKEYYMIDAEYYFINNEKMEKEVVFGFPFTIYREDEIAYDAKPKNIKLYVNNIETEPNYVFESIIVDFVETHTGEMHSKSLDLNSASSELSNIKMRDKNDISIYSIATKIQINGKVSCEQGEIISIRIMYNCPYSNSTGYKGASYEINLDSDNKMAKNIKYTCVTDTDVEIAYISQIDKNVRLHRINENIVNLVCDSFMSNNEKYFSVGLYMDKQGRGNFIFDNIQHEKASDQWNYASMTCKQIREILAIHLDISINSSMNDNLLSNAIKEYIESNVNKRSKDMVLKLYIQMKQLEKLYITTKGDDKK